MKIFFFSLIVLIVTTSCQSVPEVVSKPNVLFILVDDLGIQDLSYTGSKYYQTPHIDRLASESLIFTQGYAGSRVCSPSRATIFTGKFTARHGITNWIGEKSGEDWRTMGRHDKLLPASYTHDLPEEEFTLAEAMKANGYRTFFAGKWHLGNEGSYPEDHGFEINVGGWESGSPRGGYFSPFKNPKLEDKANGENLSARLAEETVAFMTQNKKEPFFAFLSFYAVHGPIQTSQEDWKKFQNRATAHGLASTGFVMDNKLPIRQTQDNPIYGGLVKNMDDAVGIVLNGLKVLGLDKNTIVVFTSDNGGVSSGDNFSTSNLPYRGGKGYHYEGGIKEPYLIYVPWSNSRGKTSEYPVTGADFYPTFLDYASLPPLPQQHKDGISLKPIIDNGSQPAERPLYWHYPHYGNQGGDPSSIIRLGDWKLIHLYEGFKNELYNLKTDPFETNNVAAKYPERTIQLSNQLMTWLIDVDAQFPVADEEFDAEKRKIYDDKVKNEMLPKLEKERLQMLSNDFTPNKDWWGSKLTID